MQGLTDPPRSDLAADAVSALLSGHKQVDQGCDLLDKTNRVIGDLTSAMVKGGEVTHSNVGTGTAGKCQLKFTQAQQWGAVRVRPWVTVTSPAGTTARFNQGVYVLTTPQEPSGQTPATYDVQGYDLTSVLGNQVGDTYEAVADGTLTVLDALRQVHTDSGVGTDLLVAGDAQNTVLPYTMVWAMYEGGPDWKAIYNDLLDLIGYERVWADENGALRSGLVQPVATAPPGWTFDSTSGLLVAKGWTRDEDQWGKYNAWKCIRTNMATTPTEGDGIYTPPANQSDGPSSIDSIGQTRWHIAYLDAADQASLVAQGDQIVAQDKAAGTQIHMSTFLPIAGHNDVVVFKSTAHGSEKLPVASWTTNLDGTPGAWALGGVTQPTTQPFSGSATATVTQASPLRIQIDGATVDSIANSLDGAAYAVGDRVTCTLRNPVPPLVQGKQTT